MGDVVDKVIKLIALASGPGEEARTAAHKACALIREHKLVVLGADDAEETSWIEDLRQERPASASTVHIADNDRRAFCGGYLGSGVNYFWADRVPTLRNCCTDCIREFVGKKRRRR